MSAPQRAGSTRERLLEVAEKEFARYGYAGAHLQSIAEQVGVQKTALYYYFDSKSALYTAVVRSMLESFDQVLGDAVATEGTFRERLDRLIREFNDLMAQRPNYARLLLRLFVDGAGVEYTDVGPAIQQVIGRLLAFYRAGADEGTFRRQSSRHFFLSLFGSTVFHYAAPDFGAAVLEVEDIYAPDAVRWRRDALRDLILRGVLADPDPG